MAWSLKQATSTTLFFISTHWKEWILIFLTLGASLWCLARQTVYSILRSRSLQSFDRRPARQYSNLFFWKYFCVPLLLTLPIYFTAWDYGRWFTVTCINFAMLSVSMNLPCWEFAHQKKGDTEGSTVTDSQKYVDRRLVFYGVSIIICILSLTLWLPHYCLFSCEIIKGPLQFFSHTFIAR
jgi:hypothetical protein